MTTTKTRIAGRKGFSAQPAAATASVRMCKFVAEGEVSFRLCQIKGRCERCSFAQMVEDLGR